jgi:hypothetical protein
MQLENDMTGRQVKATIEAKEKALVDHDVTKLEVKRVRQDMVPLGYLPSPGHRIFFPTHKC